MQSVESGSRRLSEVADIHVGIQTLADDVFIFPKGSVDIEPGVRRRILKASLMKDGRDSSERAVIYPYRQGRLLPEKELKARYPKAYAYLRKHKSRLLARDKGAFDPRKWYGYGREVSIVKGFGVKILTSGMNPQPNFQLCDSPKTLFYSGYCIKPRAGVSISRLLTELNSERMWQYIRLTSRPYQNGWHSYAKSYIQSFTVSEAVRANHER